MASLNDRFNQFTGRKRFVVSRLFLHLAGDEVAPLLGVLNQVGRNAIDHDGDLDIMGQGLVEICTSLLRYDTYWQSTTNEGDVLWNEGEAADYVEELFTDAAQRYLSDVNIDAEDDELTITPVQNLVVMLTLAFEGESPEIETDLASIDALKAALPAIATLHTQERLRAIQIHFSPAAYGDVLTSDQLLENFPELLPL
ncbi:DUF1517 domain-containing protein [filamentous cyanobacterium LEGE 11480]|uniref:DUF1517 domain-containing protein n=1 Tax=Romeriopsis navalis LEGE 11480 TaxID=2777977 RepID=A0A928VIW0_9CYAN|nr:DUF1517 domain-containing protein [Romeriopsis navalis]MBE9029421.1 DUF1517 domain-containing protein [Romeriopsis navalis LEGE 11480]